MKIKAIFSTLGISTLCSQALALDLANLTIPDPSTGKYTQYFFKNQTDFDGFGFGYAHVAPFIELVGPWFFIIVWSGIIYRSYAKSGTITMPIVMGLLTAPVWGVIVPGEAVMLWTVMFAVGISAIFLKYLVDSD